MAAQKKTIAEELIGRVVGSMAAEKLRLPDGAIDGEILALFFPATKNAEPFRITNDGTGERFVFEHTSFECVDLGEYGQIVNMPLFSADDDIFNCHIVSVEHLTKISEDQLNLKLSDGRVLSVWVTGDVIYLSVSEAIPEDY